MKTMVFGPFPRSEELVKATREYDRGIIGEEELKTYFKEGKEHYLEITRGITLRSNGLLNWQDIVRPFSYVLKNVEVGGLRRHFETNFFSRILHFDGKPEIVESKLEGWYMNYFDSEIENNLYTLPSPLLFYYYSNGITKYELTTIFFHIIEFLLERRESPILFLEPVIPTRGLDESDKQLLIKFYKKVREQTDEPIYIHLYFKEARELNFLLSLDIDGIGIDFYRTPISKVATHDFSDKVLIAGVINSESPHIEEREIEGFLEKISEKLDPQDIYLSPNSELHLLPHNVAIRKVELLKRWSKR